MIVWLKLIGILFGAPFVLGLLLGYIRFFSSWRFPRLGFLEFIATTGWAVVFATYHHFRYESPLRFWFPEFFTFLLFGFPVACISCWMFYRLAQALQRRSDA